MTPVRKTLAIGWPVLGFLVAGLGCPFVGDAERLLVNGDLEREGVDGSDNTTVATSFLSDSSRGEWWPCDARLTALGCVGEHHVNVYLTLPQVVQISDIGRNFCVVDSVPNGVYEAFDSPGADTFSIGSDLNAFVVVASDVVDPAGAELSNDEETTAVSRLVSGTLSVISFGGLEGNLRFFLDAETSRGNTVRVEFNGPMTNPGVIPLLEGPESCVEGALVQ